MEESEMPDFDGLRQAAKIYERKLLAPAKRKLTYAPNASDSVVVEMRGKEEMDYYGLLGAVMHAEKVIATAYYDKNMKAGAPLPASAFKPAAPQQAPRQYAQQQPAQQVPPPPAPAYQPAQAPGQPAAQAQPAPSPQPAYGWEQARAEAQKPAASQVPKPPPRQAPEPRRLVQPAGAGPTADIKSIMEQINAADDDTLARYAQKNAPEIYENFNLGGLTPVEFRRQVRLLMAKAAGIPEEAAARHMSAEENPFEQVEKMAKDEEE